MGTTTDKLNYLSETKELLRQGINNTGAGELLTSSNTFKEYVTALEEHPYHLECLVEGITIDCKVSLVTSIGHSAFKGCTSLSSVTFPNVTSMASYAFQDCAALSSVSFPKAASIGYSAFERCTSLTSASFPNATSIGEFAFAYCSSLTTLYIGTNTGTVCTLASTNSIPSSITKIYVPSSLVNSYKSATNWSSFASKIVAYTG